LSQLKDKFSDSVGIYFYDVQAAADISRSLVSHRRNPSSLATSEKDCITISNSTKTALHIPLFESLYLLLLSDKSIHS
jgi:hypothetical protein